MEPTDLEIVKRNALFRALEPTTIAEIVGDHAPRAFAKGQVLFLQGDRLDTIHLVVSGWVKLFRASEDGVDTVVAINGPGESFGEAAAMLAMPAHASAETASEARILRLDADRLRARLMADPDLAFRMLASASRHLRTMVGELEQLKSQSSVRRIAGLLVDLAGVARGPAVFDLPYDKTLIAGRLGMTPESFSRGLAKLRTAGVTVVREKVSIADVEVLTSRFCGKA